MDWGTLLLAIVGSGLLGGGLVALINAIANRGKVAAESKKIQADCVDILAEHYTGELTALREKVNALEGKIDNLECGIKSREVTIENLKKENESLTSQVEKLTKALARKDAKVLELQKQVADLTARLDAMNGRCSDESQL